MPLYEYRCHKCGETFEVRQKFSDEPLTLHENCGGEVEKLLSPPALQFKGTGWYVTDYGRNGNSSAGSKSSGKSAEPKSESTKTDTTPSAKPAAEK